ncbi:MAG: hypothetical protein J5518_05635 [Lachnospiraceae bacterium]|nr:hypothetical protein [Lachnospiraceae bacterium]
MEFFSFMGLSDLAWIGLIAFVLCIIFGLYMVITKKPGIVRSIKDTADYKDKEQYAFKGGILILCLGGACLLVVVLSFFNSVVSNVFGLVALGVFAYFWKKMHDEYGPV